ncbi:hypothetical protein [Clostridium butyricum]|uniref:hypothetical protein n=1 Tax=Clostridium butyricum TaxID=1492 RepID=UPI002ABE4101|nr:hypothetical protein [Clostridium butyricum]
MIKNLNQIFEVVEERIEELKGESKKLTIQRENLEKVSPMSKEHMKVDLKINEIKCAIRSHEMSLRMFKLDPMYQFIDLINEVVSEVNEK